MDKCGCEDHRLNEIDLTYIGSLFVEHETHSGTESISLYSCKDCDKVYRTVSYYDPFDGSSSYDDIGRCLLEKGDAVRIAGLGRIKTKEHISRGEDAFFRAILNSFGNEGDATPQIMHVGHYKEISIDDYMGKQVIMVVERGPYKDDDYPFLCSCQKIRLDSIIRQNNAISGIEGLFSEHIENCGARLIIPKKKAREVHNAIIHSYEAPERRVYPIDGEMERVLLIRTIDGRTIFDPDKLANQDHKLGNPGQVLDEECRDFCNKLEDGRIKIFWNTFIRDRYGNLNPNYSGACIYTEGDVIVYKYSSYDGCTEKDWFEGMFKKDDFRRAYNQLKGKNKVDVLGFPGRLELRNFFNEISLYFIGPINSDPSGEENRQISIRANVSKIKELL